MNAEDLVAIVNDLRAFRTDTRRVEAKASSWALPRSTSDSLSAFSNTPGGGLLILGLDESTGFSASGLVDPAKTQADLGSLCDEMEPRIRPAIEPHQFEGETIVVAEVAEVLASQKPCYHRSRGMTGGAYIRVADGDRLLSPYEVQLLLSARGQPRNDETPTPAASVDDLDPDLVGALLSRKREREGSIFRTLDDPGALQTLRVLVQHEGRLVPSLGGLLALGTYPQQFYPNLSVEFVVYPTESPGVAGPASERFLDNRRLDGPIPRILAPAVDALKSNMKTRTRMLGAFREDVWEYPEMAFREALINALCHRDLHELSHGMSVQIQMFPDRLTIISPGGIFGPVSITNLGEPGISSSRNGHLMRLLEDTPVPGEGHAVAENRGSGIGAMLAALRAAGMDPPEFVDDVSTFRVTFPNHTLLDLETLSWLEQVGGRTLTDRQGVILAMLRQNEAAITNRDYRRLTGADSRVATRELQDLVRRGILTQTGSRGLSSYHLRVEEGPNDAGD